MSPQERLNAVQLFLLDLDGTVYLGGEPIPGAVDFINHLNKIGKKYVFLTNNSSKSADDYVKKLTSMQFPVTPEQVATSGQATGWYIAKKKPGATVYIMGTEALKKEMAQFDLQILDESAKEADFFVAGFDTELNYQKLRTACDLLDNGSAFVATNPDLVCPMGGNRYIPDCGSMCMMLENATGRQPLYVGKPHSLYIDYLRETRGVSSNSLVMVGDRLYTDIALGCNASILSICVLSGEADSAAIKKSPYKPDIVVDSVADLIPMLS